jgi:hypothetical protein
MNVNGRGGNGQSGTQAAKYVPDLPYGEGQALMETQQASPLAAAPSIEQSGMPSGLASAAASQPLTRLDAQTTRPDEPVTAGAPMGAGPGMEVLGLPNNAALMNQDVQNMAKYIPYLESVANQPESSNAVRLLVRYLKSQVV